MLETLTKGFQAAANRFSGKAEITEANIDEALRDVRVSLLEADVQFQVVKTFLQRVKEKTLGEVVRLKADTSGKKIAVTPGDHFIKACYDELCALMGPVDTSLVYPRGGPAIIMMIGLQGSGKTTTTGKLASKLKKEGKRPLLVAADIYRPAAIDQLQKLGQRAGVPVFAKPGTAPPDLCAQALKEARGYQADVLIFDTAGRLAIDDELMAELESIIQLTNPHNIFLVCDAMIGQDAVKTAAGFKSRIPLTGTILTKLDGDARGGAALSIKEVTGVPIKFVGMGESMDRLDEFRPEGLASRILGMGDIVGLVKDFESVVDIEEAEKGAERMLSGRFNFEDFLQQIGMLRSLGPAQDLFEKIPFMSAQIPEGGAIAESEFRRAESMIRSMTMSERKYPKIIDDSRIRRIAKGSGHKEFEVRELLKKFNMMRQVFDAMGQQGPGILGKLPGLSQLGKLKDLAGLNLQELFGFDPEEAMAAMEPQTREISLRGGGGAHDKQRQKELDARRKAKRKQEKESRKKSRKRK
ncbi:MAG: Signal recognition particle protein [Myxococcota bacterium]|nr:Signal recognition particle protein [Myxococcota bacterium]